MNEVRWREVSDGGTDERAVDLRLAAASSLSADQETQLVNAINDKRRSEGASDMYKIVCSAHLFAIL